MWLEDRLFGRYCASCDAEIHSSRSFCEVCAQSLYPLGLACTVCALPLESGRRCARCRERPGWIRRTTCLYRHGGELERAIVRMQNGQHWIARTLAPLCRAELSAASADVDAIVPIPLHWKTAWEQMFSPARELLTWVRPAGNKVRPGLLQAQPPGASPPFRADTAVRGLRLLLFDIVIGRGRTVQAAARPLVALGAGRVDAFGLARFDQG